MKPTIDHPAALTHKLKQYQNVERQLNKLKFHLRLKRKLYDNTQYQNITERIKNCESYFKKMKGVFVRNEADKILGKKGAEHITIIKKQTTSLPLERIPSRRSLHPEQKAPDEKVYSIKLKSQRSQVSQSRVILEYDLIPIKQPNKQTPIFTTTQDPTYRRLNPKKKHPKQVTHRFISDFERSIKEKLKNIPFNNYEDVQEFDQIIKRSEVIRTDKNTEDHISKTKSLKLQSLTPNHRPNKEKPHIRIPKQNGNGRTLQAVNSQRYESLRRRMDRCRTQLSERQREQIDRVSRQNIDYSQKNRILSNYYQKYSIHSKSGDPEALSLMCAATLARADLLLKEV